MVLFRDDEIIFENQFACIYFKNNLQTICFYWKKSNWAMSEQGFTNTATALYQAISTVQAKVLYFDFSEYDQKISAEQVKTLNQFISNQSVKTCIAIDSNHSKGRSSIRQILTNPDFKSVNMHLFTNRTEGERWYFQHTYKLQSNINSMFSQAV
jgi:hypothetical protein